MQKEMIEVGGAQFGRHEITKYWVDHESAKERQIRLHYQDNHYVGSPFGLLIAGLVSTWMRKKQRKSDAKQYLHIKTAKHDYCFAEDEIDLSAVLGELGRKS